MRDQTPLVNNRLRRVQPLVQGDRQHRDNLSPKSPSCLDASSDSGTPLINTDYGEPSLWDKATENTEIISPQNPLLFWMRAQTLGHLWSKTDYGEPSLRDKATDNTEIIFPQNPLIPFWSGHGDREPLGETVCVVSGMVTS